MSSTTFLETYRSSTMSSNGESGHYEAEEVSYEVDEDNSNRYISIIKITKTSGVTSQRRFEATDMARILEFEEISNFVRDDMLRVGDFVGDGTSQISFPSYFAAMRGGFIFCFDKDDVEKGSDGRYTTFEAPPKLCIPLDNVQVQFPPGGRRVFREHAQTEAQSGYELIVQHGDRPPAFLVAESLTKRNKLGEAIKSRAGISKPTALRAGYSAAVAAATANLDDPLSRSNREERRREIESRNNEAAKESMMRNGRRESTTGATKKKIMEVSEDADLAAAVVEFGVTGFDEKDWTNQYFQVHDENEAAKTIEQMDHWLFNMKKSLKGAVLEQYEYFVQASGEMTTMGKEVSSLKARIEAQVDTLREMKSIDFYRSSNDDKSDQDEIMGRDDNSASDESEKPTGFVDDLGEMMNRHRSMNGTAETAASTDNGGSTAEDVPRIEVPDWLEEIDEEILATVRECRYSSAIELHLKGVAEVNDLIDKHEQPTAYRLTSVQLEQLRNLKKRLKVIGNRISARLEESLRRKNEALRQANKRERADALASLAPIVSPCSLNDDGHYLQLLVRMGRTQEASDAYSARRSLLLLECLQERPMSGAGTVDLVIYAAQLSQSFFSCLASSIEGFIDLFISVHTEKPEDNSEISSVNSMLVPKNVPAGAVSAIVLWCDAELSKFAIAFGGTRILANLALSPPTSGPRVVGESKDRENAIQVAAQCIDQAFLYASQNLDGVGLPLTPRLAEMVRVRLKGCEQEIANKLSERWHTLVHDWKEGVLL